MLRGVWRQAESFRARDVLKPVTRFTFPPVQPRMPRAWRNLDEEMRCWMWKYAMTKDDAAKVRALFAEAFAAPR